VNITSCNISVETNVIHQQLANYLSDGEFQLLDPAQDKLPKYFNICYFYWRISQIYFITLTFKLPCYICYNF